MKKALFYSLIALAAILLVLNVYLTMNSSGVIDVKYIHADANVSDHIGFMITNDSIMHFGNLLPDSSSSRTFTLTNGYNTPIRVKIYYEGPAWLAFSENDFVLQKNASASVDATVHVPKGAERGSYSWNISVVLLKAR